MYNLKPIYKSALSVLIKIVVLMAAAYFIFVRLTENKTLNGLLFYNNLEDIFVKNKSIFLLVLTMSVANWTLEIFKWQILVKTVQNINFKTAAKQCLSALTASLFTPNRIGDYVAKSLYFNKKNTKKIMALNFIGHGFQMGATLLFGLIGFVFLSLKYPLNLSFNTKIMAFFSVLFLVLLSFKKGRLWFEKLLNFYKNQTSNLFLKIGVLSFLRYVIFSHQYYLLLVIFGGQISYGMGMAAIFSMYLLASILPSLSVTDWVVKGSAAIFIFGFLGISPLLVMQVSLLMWVLNFAIPAVVGSVFVFQYKTSKTIVSSL